MSNTIRCLALLVTMCVAAAVGGDEPSAELTPRPDLTALEVVRIQLGALARNDSPHPDAGIEVTFRFASPGNREVTGPLPRFIAMVKNPVYRPMINHRKAEYGEPASREGRQMIPVLLTARDGTKAAYVFIVGPQDVEGCSGCWMTEGVFRIDTPGSAEAI